MWLLQAELAVFPLIAFFLLLLPLPAVLRTSGRVPLSLRYFLGGVIGLAAQATVWFAGPWEQTWELYVLLVMFHLSPIWFSIGARRSLEELEGRRAKVLRWLNVVGFAGWVGFTFMVGTIPSILTYPAYHFAIPVVIPVVVGLGFSRVVLSWPPTRFRWVRFLPGHRAILLAPVALVTWAMLCYVLGLGYGGLGWGFPLVYLNLEMGRVCVDFSFRVVPFLVDLLLALVAAWVIAMAVDRLVFPWVRARQGVDRAPDDSN